MAAAALRKAPPGGATTTAPGTQRHLLVVLLAAAAAAGLGYLPWPAAAAATATCPDNLALRLRMCVMTSGLLDALTRTGIEEGVVMDFCQSGVRASVDCLTSYEVACGEFPDGNGTLALMVDMDRVQANLEVFCGSLLSLQRQSSCLRPNATECVNRVTDDFMTHDTSHLGAKGIIDMTCDFFDDVQLCLTFEEGEPCYQPATTLQRLVKAYRFPYCDLSPEEREAVPARFLPLDKIFEPPPETTTKTPTTTTTTTTTTTVVTSTSDVASSVAANVAGGSSSGAQSSAASRSLLLPAGTGLLTVLIIRFAADAAP